MDARGGKVGLNLTALWAQNSAHISELVVRKQPQSQEVPDPLIPSAEQLFQIPFRLTTSKLIRMMLKPVITPIRSLIRPN